MTGPNPSPKSPLSVILPGTILLPHAGGQLTSTVTQPELQKQKKFFPTLVQAIPHFLPQEVFRSMMYLGQSLVWRPQPSIHTGLAGPVVPVQECRLPVTFSRVFPRSGPLRTASKIRCRLYQAPH